MKTKGEGRGKMCSKHFHQGEVINFLEDHPLSSQPDTKCVRVRVGEKF